MNVRGGLMMVALVAAGLGIRALPSPAPSASAAWWPFGGSTIVTVYFTDGGLLFPVSRRIPATDNLPRAALQALLDGPGARSGLTSPIPEGVQIRSLTLSDGVARVDLSSWAVGDGNDAAKASIVQTLTALPDVRSVELSVDGKSLASSTVRTPLLYYASAKGLVAVPSAARDTRQAIAAYMAGPPDPALTGVPRDVRLIKYEYEPKGGVTSLNFAYTDSVRTLALEKPDIMRSVLLGLIASLTELPGVRAVRIDFDGHTRLGLGECSDLLRTPQPRPRLLNDERLLGS